jgi:hypothetical protein
MKLGCGKWEPVGYGGKGSAALASIPKHGNSTRQYLFFPLMSQLFKKIQQGLNQVQKSDN